MDFWKALGVIFAFLFVPPAFPRMDNLRHPGELRTAKNVFFGLFWGFILLVALGAGVRERFQEHLDLDVGSYHGWRSWIMSWLSIEASEVLGCLAMLMLLLLYWSPQFLRKPFDATLVFIRELRANYFFFQTRDDDGEIMIVEVMEELIVPAATKKRTVIGVPRSIRRKQQRSIDSAYESILAQTIAPDGSVPGGTVIIRNPHYGSLGRATKAIKKK